MEVRSYRREDAVGITRLFYETVHTVNRADYSTEQVKAWAPEIPGPEVWHERMNRRHALVAEEGGEVIAFAELEMDGHLDTFYCRRDSVGRSVGSRLYEAVEKEAGDRNLARISTEASITARPFFERRGFVVLGRRVVVRPGVELTNFAMEKRLEEDAGVGRRSV